MCNAFESRLVDGVKLFDNLVAAADWRTSMHRETRSGPHSSRIRIQGGSGPGPLFPAVFRGPVFRGMQRNSGAGDRLYLVGQGPTSSTPRTASSSGSCCMASPAAPATTSSAMSPPACRTAFAFIAPAMARAVAGQAGSSQSYAAIADSPAWRRRLHHERIARCAGLSIVYVSRAAAPIIKSVTATIEKFVDHPERCRSAMSERPAKLCSRYKL
jgi:hypothetical protein